MSEDPITIQISEFLSQPISGTSFGFSRNGYVVSTTTGRVRKENQDVALVVAARYAGQPERDFDAAIVCDGMGGMRDGRAAALVAASTFASRLIRATRVPAIRRMHDSIRFANQLVFESLGGSGGCTLSAVLFCRDRPVVCGHVGDSRIYAIHNNIPKQISQDDTFDAFKKEKRQGEPRDNRIFQFIGIGDELEPHVFPSDNVEATYVLTSDGAHDISDETFARLVKAASERGDLASNLIRVSEMMGGLDNATAITTQSNLSNLNIVREGMMLRLIAPYAEGSIWVPQLYGNEKSNIYNNKDYNSPIGGSDGQKEYLKAGGNTASYALIPQIYKKKTSKKKLRPSSKSGAEKPDPNNKDQPTLNIEFPNKENQND